MNIKTDTNCSKERITAFGIWLVQEMTFHGIGLPDSFTFDGERHFFKATKSSDSEESWYQVKLSRQSAYGAIGSGSAEVPFKLDLKALEAARADPEAFSAFCSADGRLPIVTGDERAPSFPERAMTLLFNALMRSGIGTPTKFTLDGSLQHFEAVTHKEPGGRWYAIKLDANVIVGAFGDSEAKTVYPIFQQDDGTDGQKGHA